MGPLDVLVAVAHPDDEILGVGGTILRHLAAGDRVHVHIACTKGLLRDRDARVTAALGLAEKMGTTVTFGKAKQLGYRVPIMPDVPADIVYTHFRGDLNRDHRLVNEAALIAGRNRRVYEFETPSSTEWGLSAFAAQRFVAIDVNSKLECLAFYDAEMREFPHPRSYPAVYALAKWRGAMAGLDAAEAFAVVRETW